MFSTPLTTSGSSGKRKLNQDDGSEQPNKLQKTNGFNGCVIDGSSQTQRTKSPKKNRKRRRSKANGSIAQVNAEQNVGSTTSVGSMAQVNAEQNVVSTTNVGSNVQVKAEQHVVTTTNVGSTNVGSIATVGSASNPGSTTNVGHKSAAYGTKPVYSSKQRSWPKWSSSSRENQPTPQLQGHCSTWAEGLYRQQVHDMRSRYVALDCEFVGVEPRDTSALGRCSIVDFNGRILCDIYARPERRITSFRTRWSGLRPRDMINAVPLQFALKTIRNIIKDKVVVGHSLHNDFGVMGILLPKERARDISRYVPLRLMAGFDPSQVASLKRLSSALLGRNIQRREHCSTEDARATMDLFKLVCRDWEEEINRCGSKFSRNEFQTRIRTNSNNYMDDEFWPSHVV